MASQRKQSGRAASRGRFFWLAFAMALALAAALAFRAGRNERKSQTPSPPRAAKETDTAIFAAYGNSPSCKSCHEAEFQLWENSHHALAERPLNPALDLV